MKFTILTLAAMLVMTGCTTSGATGELVGREWKLVWVEEFPTMPSGVANPTVTFGSDGRLTGNTGCNSASASYTVEGDQLSIGALITTKRACVESAGQQLEQAYIRAVEATRRYRIEGAELQLLDDGGTVLARFR